MYSGKVLPYTQYPAQLQLFSGARNNLFNTTCLLVTLYSEQLNKEKIWSNQSANSIFKFYTNQHLSKTAGKGSYLSHSWWGQSHCELLSNWNDRNLSHRYQNHQIWAEFAAQALHGFPIHKQCYWERSGGNLLKQEFHSQGPKLCVHIHHLQKNKKLSTTFIQSFTGDLVTLFFSSAVRFAGFY